MNNTLDKIKSILIKNYDIDDVSVISYGDDLGNIISYDIIVTKDGQPNTFSLYSDKLNEEEINNIISYMVASANLYENIINESITNAANIAPTIKQIKENTIEEDKTKETDTTLLIALDSEKDAVETYEALIKMSESEEIKELLKTILDDEKEHIALLSALQAKENKNFVGKDVEMTFDSYIDDIR